jgi:hypothetical protein
MENLLIIYCVVSLSIFILLEIIRQLYTEKSETLSEIYGISGFDLNCFISLNWFGVLIVYLYNKMFKK